MLDEEFIAINLLNESLKLNPVNYSSLVIQAEYLMKKNSYDLALQCAKKAVNYAPSEFITWEILTQVYISLEDYKMVSHKVLMKKLLKLYKGFVNFKFMSNIYLL